MAAFFRPGKASVIVGGQFGSEAKGLAAAHLALNDVSTTIRVISTTNAGAQAGHTTVLPDGRKFVCFHLPTIGVLLKTSTIYLNAGSIIDLDLLKKEVEAVSSVTGELEEDLWDRIVIHPHAAVIQDKHKEAEAAGSSTAAIGSTQKGVGAALVSKIRREPDAVMAAHAEKVPCMVERIDLNRVLDNGAIAVTVEIPQGTGLSINASDFYPHCTSRDCWVGQGLTDAGIHPKHLGAVAMVVRTYPIRVGNNVKDGVEIGNSGTFFSDSEELNWDGNFPNVEPERTTVTKRVRRIATWSRDQYVRALHLNRPDFIFLTFTNYLYEYVPDDQLFPDAAAQRMTLTEFAGLMDEAEAEVGLNPAHIYSWGPRADQCSFDQEHALYRSKEAARSVPIQAAE